MDLLIIASSLIPSVVVAIIAWQRGGISGLRDQRHLIGGLALITVGISVVVAAIDVRASEPAILGALSVVSSIMAMALYLRRGNSIYARPRWLLALAVAFLLLAIYGSQVKP